jgi:hypothetical protein
MNKDVIDSFFDNNDIVFIKSLRFGGGEPTLNSEILLYLVDKIISKGIDINHFITSINGLNYSKDFILALNILNDYCKRKSGSASDRCGILYVSQTQYHKPALDLVISKLKELPYFINSSGIDYIMPSDLLPYGNAYKNKLTNNKQDIDLITNYDGSFNIISALNDNYIAFNSQYISADGNVLIDGCISYDMMKKYAIGNVKYDTIQDIYSKQPKMLRLKN